jgi:predicted oxidoreductase
MWRGDAPKTVRQNVIYLEQGIATMDQADIYGGYMAEEIMGWVTTQDIRDQIEVTKCDILALPGIFRIPRANITTPRVTLIVASVDHSLRLMGITRLMSCLSIAIR